MMNCPKVVLDTQKLRKNIRCIKGLCHSENVSLAGVVKGANGIEKVNEIFIEEGVEIISSSRISHIRKVRQVGKAMGKTNFETMLIRIPMKTEIDEVVSFCDISLNSEIEVLRELNREAEKVGRVHKVIIMFDLGDLREGFFEVKEGISCALEVEHSLKNLELLGIGTNLGCYGAIKVTEDKMLDLIAIAEEIEEKIGRKLKFLSGGGTTALPLLLDGTMPDRINLLRIGEAMLLTQDLKEDWGHILKDCSQDAFTLHMEVIEIKNKATYPIGEIALDGFGQKHTYEDRGVRKRALLAGGKVDYGLPEMLIPVEKGVAIVGASSDHTIIDVEDMERELKVGDVLEFQLTYATLVYSTGSADIGLEIV